MDGPSRIVSLLPSATEMLYVLGLGDRVVAVSHECDYPQEVKDKPRVTVSRIGGAQSSSAIDLAVQHNLTTKQSLYEIDLPLLERLECDLIITQSQCEVCAVEYGEVVAALEKLGIKHRAPIITLHPQSLEEVFQDLIKIGRACGKAQFAESKVASYRQRIADVHHKLVHLQGEDRPRTAMIEWIDPLMLAGNWIPELVDLAAGRVPYLKSSGKSLVAAWDEVVAFNPQVMVLCPCGFDLSKTCQEAKEIKHWPDVDALQAVCDGRCYAVDGNAYFNRSGPRLVDSLEILAHLLHPQQISAPTWSMSQDPAWCQLPLKNEAP